MKNLIYLFVGALILSVYFSGCKKKDDTPNNSFKYEDTEYDLSQGFLENYGLWDQVGTYNIDLSLASSGFTFYEVDGEIDSISGTGHLIYFETFSPSAGKLDDGDYTFDATESGTAFTFDLSSVVIDFNILTETGTVLDINGGTLTIKANGDEYEVSFDLTNTTGKKITGFFKGKLKSYDYSGIGGRASTGLFKSKRF